MALDPNIGRIKFLRSKTAGRLPTTADIDEGELALNLVDRTIYTRNGNNIVDIGFGLGGQVNGNITASGTVKATKLEGPLTGNAATATKLQTARAINGVSFDGTSNIVIADSTKLPLTGGSLSGKLTTKPSYLAQNLDDIGAGDNSPIRVPGQLIPLDMTGYIPFVHGSVVTDGSGYQTHVSMGAYRGSNTWDNSGVYLAVGGKDVAPTEAFMFLNGRKISNTAGPINLVGNASTATKLQTARTIGGVSFDGTANINLPGVNTAGTQSTTGNADTATKLQTGRSINGTNFDGSGNIVTDYWGTSRTFSFGNTTKSVNGSGNMTWTLAEMGAFPLVGGTITGNVKINGLLTIDVSNDIGTFKKLVEGLTQTDGGYLAVGNSGADKGYVELGTTDDADAEIYATQRGTTNTIIRRATLLDGNGNTTFPGTVNAASFNGSFTGDMSGNASSATKLQTARLINGETFDGTQAVSIKNIRSLGRKPATDEKTTYPLDTMSYSEVYKNGFPFDYGNAIFIQGGSGTNQLAFEWGAAASGYQRAFLRCATDISNTWGPWREFAFTNGTIDIAKKLETPRKINGVNFDGTQDITVADSTKLPLTGGNINGNLGVFGRLTSTDVVKGVHFHATGVDNWMPTAQGSWITWNSRAPGQGQFEFVNHQGAGAGGFTWYSGNSFNQTALMRLYGDGSLHVTRDVRVDASLNLANNTWNTIGDDVRIGDKNVANKLAIQGTWGPGGVAFFHNDSQVGSIDSVSYTGNAATATALQTARTINGVSFNGTTDIQIDAIRVGTISWHLGNRSSVFTGDLVCDGQVLNRADYPELWNMVNAGRFASVTDAVWLSDVSKRGAYSTGNGSTTFRLPDLNGGQAGSIPDLFLRGTKATNAGTVLDDAIRNITGAFGTSADQYSSSSASGSFEKIEGEYSQWLGHTNGANGNLGSFSFNASRVVPTADENRPKSVFGIWVVSAKGSNVAVPGGSTAATLTGGNTFQGSQTINGDLIVNQNETVKGNLTVEGLTADRFGLHDKMHWVGAYVKPYGTSVLGASVTTNTFQVIIRGESGAKYWTKGRTKLHFIINHGTPQNARFVTATVTDWSTTDSNKQTITATLSLVNHAMPLNTVFHWVGSTYESFGCDWAGWMNSVGDSRLAMRLKPTTPLKSLAPIITSSCSSDVYWNASQLSQPGVEPQQRSGMGSIVINSVHEGDVVFAIGDNNNDGSVSNEYVSISVKDFV